MTEQAPSPFPLFQTWLADARVSETEDADAACVATVGEDGMPDARMVLVRDIDKRGFAFYTNYNSRKGQDLLAHPKAALCFHWKSLRRQVRVQGAVERTGTAEADAYFKSRQRGSRIASIASRQSEILPDRETLIARVLETEDEFHGVENPPRPEHWSGFRVVPERIEFWQQMEFRLHERVVYVKTPDGWTTDMLYP